MSSGIVFQQNIWRLVIICSRIRYLPLVCISHKDPLHTKWFFVNIHHESVISLWLEQKDICYCNLSASFLLSTQTYETVYLIILIQIPRTQDLSIKKVTNLSIPKYSINRLTDIIRKSSRAAWCQKTHSSHSIEWINLFLVSAFDLYPFSLCHMINLMYFLLNWMKMYNLSRIYTFIQPTLFYNTISTQPLSHSTRLNPCIYLVSAWTQYQKNV